MKMIIALIGILVTVASAQYVNIQTGREQAALPAVIELPGRVVHRPTLADCLPLGIRLRGPDAEPAPGFQKLGQTWSQDPADPERAIAVVNQVEESLWQAQQAAEAAAALAPVDFPTGIAIPCQTNGTPYYAIAAVDGDLVTYEAHSSPYDHAKAESNKLSAISTHRSAKAAAKAGVNGQLQTRIENIERLMGLR